MLAVVSGALTIAFLVISAAIPSAFGSFILLAFLSLSVFGLAAIMAQKRARRINYPSMEEIAANHEESLTKTLMNDSPVDLH